MNTRSVAPFPPNENNPPRLGGGLSGEQIRKSMRMRKMPPGYLRLSLGTTTTQLAVAELLLESVTLQTIE